MHCRCPIVPMRAETHYRLAGMRRSAAIIRAEGEALSDTDGSGIRHTGIRGPLSPGRGYLGCLRVRGNILTLYDCVNSAGVERGGKEINNTDEVRNETQNSTWPHDFRCFCDLFRKVRECFFIYFLTLSIHPLFNPLITKIRW